ncbi:MAG: OprO/OprP family phosphate-selective porin, partial [Candidatus Omnitrophica bacterium]|nr:OprO/OprP family phosphate-selective porin [Candidatus Omnitrophota bacterium]
MKTNQTTNRCKWMPLAAAGLMVLCALAGAGSARNSDALVNALVKKGILTQNEAEDIQAELGKENTSSNTSPLVLPLGKETNLKLGGFLQANAEFGDVSSFEGRLADGPNALDNRFRLRRARISLSGDFLKQFDFKLEGDFEQGDGINGNRTGFSGTDLYVNYRQYPEANLRLGQFKAPYGLEQLTPDTTLFTAERSLVTDALTPERQVGFQIWGKPLANLWPDRKDFLTYSFGMFNGNGRNISINDGNNFMYAGRLELTPYSDILWNLPAQWRLGLDGLYSRDAASVNLSPVGNLLLQPDGSLLPFTTHSPDERRAWGVDQTFTIGPFGLTAEYLEEHYRPTSSPANFNEFVANGYYVQG